MSYLTNKIKRKIHNFFHPKLGEILMLHRVMEVRSRLKLNRDIEITPDFLEQTICDYRRRGYSFVSLDEASDIISGKKKSKKPFVCFTFDDGYRDNFEEAYPIFKKYDCPFTVYVTTDFIDYKAVIWWYVLEDLLRENAEIHLSDGTAYRTDTPEARDEAFLQLHRRISALDINDLKQTFNDWFSDYSFSFEQKVRELSMTKEQLQLLATEPLCTIGSHTVSHPHLEGMSEEAQRQELLQSKQKLEAWTGKAVRHFAYPFGSHDDTSVSLVAPCGYETAVLVLGGAVRKGFKNKALLPREILRQA